MDIILEKHSFHSMYALHATSSSSSALPLTFLLREEALHVLRFFGLVHRELSRGPNASIQNIGVFTSSNKNLQNLLEITNVVRRVPAQRVPPLSVNKKKTSQKEKRRAQKAILRQVNKANFSKVVAETYVKGPNFAFLGAERRLLVVVLEALEAWNGVGPFALVLRHAVRHFPTAATLTLDVVHEYFDKLFQMSRAVQGTTNKASKKHHCCYIGYDGVVQAGKGHRAAKPLVDFLHFMDRGFMLLGQVLLKILTHAKSFSFPETWKLERALGCLEAMFQKKRDDLNKLKVFGSIHYEPETYLDGHVDRSLFLTFITTCTPQKYEHEDTLGFADDEEEEIKYNKSYSYLDVVVFLADVYHQSIPTAKSRAIVNMFV
jgi:hypothetical protein